jgi:hypothetical protein
MGPEADRVATRLQRGCRCFGAAIYSQFAGYGWLTTDTEWMGELELEIRPGVKEAYVWNCVTLLEHRRKGVFSAILKSMRAELSKEGLTRLWIGSIEDPAEKAISDSGFVPVVRFDSTSRWGGRLLRMRPAYKTAPSLKNAATQVLAGKGVPLGSGFYLRQSETRKH